MVGELRRPWHGWRLDYIQYCYQPYQCFIAINNNATLKVNIISSKVIVKTLILERLEGIMMQRRGEFDVLPFTTGFLNHGLEDNSVQSH
jgi:hypothetical protein|tara:strand:- start:135 stop:401 length:267 start_codon:yes stop_codon:yes gene_type:complete